MKILLVEDDEQIAEALEQVLTDKQHYVMDAVGDGEIAWQFIESSAYDLIILDIMLPKLDGISLCRRLRGKGFMTPVLMLTAKDASSDRVMGLDVGADDYVIKPFDLPELLARIRALMRRGSAIQTPLLEVNGLCLNPSSCEVTYQGQLVIRAIGATPTNNNFTSVAFLGKPLPPNLLLKIVPKPRIVRTKCYVFDTPHPNFHKSKIL